MVEGKKELVRKIALERMQILFGLAGNEIGSRPGLARRYVAEIRELSAHYKVSMPRAMRNSICGSCGTLMVPGLNATVRVVSSGRYVAYVCKGCGRQRHVRY